MSIELNDILLILLRVWNWDLRALVVSQWRNFITNLLKPQNFRKYSMWVKLLHKMVMIWGKKNTFSNDKILLQMDSFVYFELLSLIIVSCPHISTMVHHALKCLLSHAPSKSYMTNVFLYPWPQRSLPSPLQPCSCLPCSLVALKFWRKSTTSTYHYVIAVLFHELPGPLFSMSSEAASLFFFLHPFLVSVVKTFRKGLKQIESFSEVLIKADRNTGTSLLYPATN